jgi:hypothetical protein
LGGLLLSSIKLREPNLLIQLKNKKRDTLFNYGSPTLDLYTATIDDFRNEYGCLRWHKFRTAYHMGLIPDEMVLPFYLSWRDDSEYFMLNGLDIQDKHVLSVFVKAAKRGNDVYKKLINDKFSFLDSLEPIHFFNDWGIKKTPMLFITFTIDTKRFNRDTAYQLISTKLNRFETLLRQKYGSFVKFRVWEVHESGYPHAHVVYYFHNKEFQVWEHLSKKGKQTFRIGNKHKDAISKMWDMGFIDIQGVQDTLGAFSEVKKYITKNIWSNKADLTNAFLTLYRKQSYWVSTCDYCKQVDKLELSGSINERSDKILEKIDSWIKKDFVGSIWGVGAYIEMYNKRNSLAEPSEAGLVMQTMCNYNIDKPEIVKWEFVGFISGCDLASFVPNFNDGYVYEMDKPPPELYTCLHVSAYRLSAIM